MADTSYARPESTAAPKSDSHAHNSIKASGDAAALKIIHEQNFLGVGGGIPGFGTGFALAGKDVGPAFKGKNGEDCYISTADHVVHNNPTYRGRLGNTTVELPLDMKDPGKTTVTLPDGKVVKGTVAQEDPQHDTALVKISGKDAKGFCTPGKLGDANELQPGDKVTGSGFHTGSLLNTEKTFAGPTTVQEVRNSYGFESASYAGRLDPNQKLLMFTSPGGRSGGGDSGGPIRNSKGEIVAQNIMGVDHKNADGSITHLSFGTPFEKH